MPPAVTREEYDPLSCKAADHEVVRRRTEGRIHYRFRPVRQFGHFI
jgi:hypothetical protein